MAGSRKDNKGRVLRKGETQRSRDGKYVYTYTGPDGKRRSIYSKDILKLREREDKLIKDRLDGLNVSAALNTVNRVFDRFISLKSGISDDTKKFYIYMYNHYIRDCRLGSLKIADVRYSDILQLYQYLVKEKELKLKTLGVIHAVIHQVFQLALRDNIIKSNPSDGVLADVKKIPGNKQEIRHALSPEQQRVFIRYVEESPEFYGWTSLFKFLLGTGCRIGEAIGLRWSDVDFENRLININHSLKYYGNKRKERFGVSTTKTAAGMRTIPMMDAVYETLKDELEYQQENGFCKEKIGVINDFIFVDGSGMLHIPGQVNKTIMRIYKEYNANEVLNAKKDQREPVILPHFTCHNLRHTFCSRLCENETNIKVIQSLMGHSSIQITMDIYTEITEKKKQEAIQNLVNKLNIF